MPLALVFAMPLAAHAKQPPAAESSAAYTSTLRVTCGGEDIGARVTVNGVFKGQCPLDIPVAPGTLTVRAEKQDASYDGAFEQEIRVGDHVVREVDAVLSRSLSAAAQQRLRETKEARKHAGAGAELAVEMVRVPGKNYEIGKTEVTQGLWMAVMGANPSHFGNCGDTCPVENVSWKEAQEFIQKLNARTGKHYRLPTQTEWEYACYGGSQTEYCGGNDLDLAGWSGPNSGGKTHPVGQKQANGYGLYDMSGNVWEWTSNCWEGDCAWRVLRGGSWSNDLRNMRAAYRFRIVPSSWNGNTGFRLARTLP